MHKGHAVKVSWVDSCSTHGWNNRRDVRVEPSTIESVGWLVDRSKKSVRLALSRATDGYSTELGDFLVIPACAVVKLRRIS